MPCGARWRSLTYSIAVWSSPRSRSCSASRTSSRFIAPSSAGRERRRLATGGRTPGAPRPAPERGRLPRDGGLADLLQHLHQSFALGDRQSREDPLLVPLDVDEHGLEARLAFRREAQRIAAAIGVRPHATQEASLGQAIEADGEGRLVDADALAELLLRLVGVLVDDDENAELARRELRHGRVALEVLVDRELRPSQAKAEEAGERPEVQASAPFRLHAPETNRISVNPLEEAPGDRRRVQGRAVLVDDVAIDGGIGRAVQRARRDRAKDDPHAAVALVPK